jgi:uncharacterized membrane protein YeaQ/YmgE (transglycosylase-associated protein family)
MNFIIWLLAGAACGWLASRFAEPQTDPGIALNVLTGVIGAYLGGRALGPLLGIANSDQGEFSFVSVLLAIVVAAIALAGSRYLRRGRSV